MVTAKRASFCAARPRGPGVPGAGDNQACPGRLDRSCGPRLERREPAGDGVKAGSEVEVVWGSPTPLQDRLFEFSEVGSAQLKGAWVFLFNPQRSRAKEACTKLGAPQEAHPSAHQILHPGPLIHILNFPYPGGKDIQVSMEPHHLRSLSAPSFRNGT